MSPELAERWALALESNRYKQTTGYLQANADNRRGVFAGYCCLGVLCELAVEDGIIPPPNFTSGVAAYAKDYQRTRLPLEVQLWAKMRTASGIFGTNPWGEPYLNQALDVMNDHGADFNKIAETIRTHKEVL